MFPLPATEVAGPNKATVSAQLVRNIVSAKLIKIFFNFPLTFTNAYMLFELHKNINLLTLSLSKTTRNCNIYFTLSLELAYFSYMN